MSICRMRNGLASETLPDSHQAGKPTRSGVCGVFVCSSHPYLPLLVFVLRVEEWVRVWVRAWGVGEGVDEVEEVDSDAVKSCEVSLSSRLTDRAREAFPEHYRPPALHSLHLPSTSTMTPSTPPHTLHVPSIHRPSTQTQGGGGGGGSSGGKRKPVSPPELRTRSG